MIFELVGKIEAKQHLTQAEASALMQELLGGRVEEAEIVSLLTALGNKGATLEERVGFAQDGFELFVGDVHNGTTP